MTRGGLHKKQNPQRLASELIARAKRFRSPRGCISRRHREYTVLFSIFRRLAEATLSVGSYFALFFQLLT
jgi:hypothetical protein